MRFRMTPPHVFAAISLVLIAATAAATSFTQASFFRQAIIDRVSSVIYDMVRVDILEKEEEHQLSLSDLERYVDSTAQQHLEHSFRGLKKLSGVVLIKVFNRNRTIVWSDLPGLVGTNLTSNKDDLDRAMQGEVRAVFNRSDWGLPPMTTLSRAPIIEFYVPFALRNADGSSGATSGVVSIYRAPDELNETIRHGLLLLWLVTGLGGLILFIALYRLFRSVYYRQRETESQFAKFTMEHERIMRIEKLSALGQMVSEIAHQLNNPLVGVVNLAELAEREADDPRRVRELLAEVRKAGDHCRDFVQRMLLLNKVTRSEPQPTDMNGVVRETIAFFQQSLGGHPAVNFESPAQPVIAEVDPVLVRHALFNLIHNAAQADTMGPVVVALAPEARNGVPGCSVTVSDSGPGIAPEVQGKLFTPFFTTRAGGTGLGLSVAQHVAEQHGGTIQAENRSEGGARFTIWLPAQKQNP